MNSQTVYDTWKKLVLKYTSAVPPEADKYVLGDDSMFDLIPSVIMLYKYPSVLLAELECECGEMAKRCLRALAKMNKEGLLVGPNPVATVKSFGFTFKDIVEMKNKSRVLSFAGESDVKICCRAYELMKEQALEYVTAERLKKCLMGNNNTNPFILFYTAALMVCDGTADKKQFCELIYEYGEGAQIFSSVGIVLLFCKVYSYDKRIKDRLRLLLQSLRVISSLNRVYGGETKKIMTELGLGNYYYYAVLVNESDNKERTAAEIAVSESHDKLLPWVFEQVFDHTVVEKPKKVLPTESLMRTLQQLTDKYVKKTELDSCGEFDMNKLHEFYCVTVPLALALKNGNGMDVLNKYEKFLTSLIACISSYFKPINSNPSDVKDKSFGVNFAKMICENPDETARKYCYDTSNFGMRSISDAFEVFALIFDYSDKARKIVYTVVKMADYQKTRDAYIMSSTIIGTFCDARVRLDISSEDSIKALISSGIDINTVFMASSYYGAKIVWNYFLKEIDVCMPAIVSENMSAAEAFYDIIKDDAKLSAFWAEMLYKKSGCTNTELLLTLLKSKSKIVRKIASEVTSADEESFRDKLEALVPKLKGESLEQVMGIIKKWDNNKKYGKDFDFADNTLAEAYVAENLNPAAIKKTAFIPEEYFADVRYADLSGKASKELVRYIIGEYFCLEEPYRIAVCDKLAAKLYKPDFCDCIENIYLEWLENGADNKTKAIMIPYCIYASDTQILALKKQLVAWTEAARGALGAYIIKAVAINGGSTALMMVNDISVKFPDNRVKKAAKAAFSYAARALELPEDVLADKIVPTLGLDKNGEAVLDYGARTFTVSLMPDFSLSFRDNDKNKDIKSLPKAAAGDDEIKAEEAKKYVSELKKQLKAITAAQKTRLEVVFANGRTWSAEAWSELFVENPVMHRFAATLIWGVYKDGKLAGSFRYCDDGTFCDENDDAFELDKTAEISLIHPCEMTAESIAAWLEQLSDYEIVQPFAQISANVITLADSEIDSRHYVTKYQNRSFTVASMNNAAKKHNFIRSSVEDAGGFSGYHIQDNVLGTGVKFGFENMYMGQNYDEKIELTNVYFYRLPDAEERPDSYEEYDALSPREVSERFVSCCLNTLETILD